MRGMWALVLAGCTSTVGSGTSGGGAGIAACGSLQPFDETVFAQLTAVEWEDSGCASTDPLPPTCNRIQLGADGQFAWTAISDVLERDQHGAWNFSARSDTAGIVCLDTGAVLPFELAGDVMRLGGRGYTPGMALTSTGWRSNLLRVLSDPIYAQMSAHPWTKTNAFDLFMYPQDLTLAPDGTYEASYRGGTCSHGGTWGIDLEPRTGGPVPIVVDTADPNTCDLRGNTSAQLPASDVPRIVDRRLVFYSVAYRSPGGPDPRSWLSFDGYSESVTASGYLDTELAASAPTTFELDLENRSTTDKTLASLTARMTPLALGTDGYTSTGPKVDLASAPLAGTVLAPGDHYALALAVTPPAAGDSQLELELDFSDATQSYASHGYFVVTVGP